MLVSYGYEWMEAPDWYKAAWTNSEYPGTVRQEAVMMYWLLSSCPVSNILYSC